ncbi:MAG: glycosyltransferase, partial [Chloroflexi bacterium]|nr:glycosyltransferase [Chloroflexota bacterium]
MARRALPMARALAERGHHVAVVLPPWSNPSDSGRCYDDGGVRVENLVLPPRIPFIFELLLCTALIRRALAIQPEVIHCFKPKAYAGVCAWVVWHLRGLGLTRARLVVDSDDWEGAGGWNEVERYSWLLKRFFAWQEQWGLIHADAITVASRTLESLVWGPGVSPSKVFYVPNGSSDVTIEHRVEPREPNLLLYTRFFEFKIERVARLFAAIAA